MNLISLVHCFLNTKLRFIVQNRFFSIPLIKYWTTLNSDKILKKH